MKNLKVHVLYEQGADLRPHGGSYLRLLRPLSHPLVKGKVEVTYSRYLPTCPVDIIIIDRLWRSFDISANMAMELVKKSKTCCSKIFYAFDDNFEQWVKYINIFSSHYGDVFNIFLEAADGIIVTSKSLFDEFSKIQTNAILIPNMLDERLLVPKVLENNNNKLRIGYMGTSTHDGDLKILLPVFQRLYKRYADNLSFELIGILTKEGLNKIPELSEIPVHIISPRSTEIEYPLFMLWYTQFINWDIAVAPLEDIPFNFYKSDVKLLDYAAVGAAGVFSNCAAYMNTIKHQEYGLLVENYSEAWLEAITLLIENPELRNQVRLNAYKYLFEQRILAKTAHLWVDGIEQLWIGNNHY